MLMANPNPTHDEIDKQVQNAQNHDFENLMSQFSEADRCIQIVDILDIELAEIAAEWHADDREHYREVNQLNLMVQWRLPIPEHVNEQRRSQTGSVYRIQDQLISFGRHLRDLREEFTQPMRTSDGLKVCSRIKAMEAHLAVLQSQMIRRLEELYEYNTYNSSKSCG